MQSAGSSRLLDLECVELSVEVEWTLKRLAFCLECMLLHSKQGCVCWQSVHLFGCTTMVEWCRWLLRTAPRTSFTRKVSSVICFFLSLPAWRCELPCPIFDWLCQCWLETTLLDNFYPIEEGQNDITPKLLFIIERTSIESSTEHKLENAVDRGLSRPSAAQFWACLDRQCVFWIGVQGLLWQVCRALICFVGKQQNSPNVSHRGLSWSRFL